MSEKTRQKRLEVLSAALACFTEHGVDGTTIEMIRDASGMSVGSLYHHFGNKEKIASALFREGMRSYAKLVKRYMLELIENNQPPKIRDAVKAMVYANVDWIQGHQDWARFVFHHRSLVTASGEESAFRSDFSVFSKMLAGWAEQMGVKGFEHLDMAFVTAIVNGPTHAYARQWLAKRVEKPLSDHREAFAEAAWYSVEGVFIKGSSTS